MRIAGLDLHWLLCLLFLLKICNSSIQCKRGHWPAADYCDFRQSNDDFLIISIASNGSSEWKASFRAESSYFSVSSHYPNHCDFTFEDVAIFPVLFDRKTYDSLGSNYYIVHTDILLPFFASYLDSARRFSPPKTAFPFPLNSNGLPILFDNWFGNPNGYWMTSLSVLLKGTNTSIFPLLTDQFATIWQFSDPLTLCFRRSTFGFPDMQRPRHSLVQRFAHHFRVHALQSRGYALLDNPLEEKKQICQNSIKTIGIVNRTHKRRFINQEAIESWIVHNISDIYCRKKAESTRVIRQEQQDLMDEKNQPYSSCQLQVKWLDLGKKSIEEEIEELQTLAMLMGIQGSGMINGLYTNPMASSVAIYPGHLWPYSSGDPLALLGAVGSYRALINPKSQWLRCSQQDQFSCDDGDILMEYPQLQTLVVEILSDMDQRCATIQSSFQ